MSELTRSADQAIERVRQEIALLNEFRTALIADVVTGKLDVREASKGLPDDDAESLVESVALHGPEGDMADDLDDVPEEVTV